LFKSIKYVDFLTGFKRKHYIRKTNTKISAHPEPEPNFSDTGLPAVG